MAFIEIKQNCDAVNRVNALDCMQSLHFVSIIVFGMNMSIAGTFPVSVLCFIYLWWTFKLGRRHAMRAFKCDLLPEAVETDSWKSSSAPSWAATNTIGHPQLPFNPLTCITRCKTLAYWLQSTASPNAWRSAGCNRWNAQLSCFYNNRRQCVIQIIVWLSVLGWCVYDPKVRFQGQQSDFTVESLSKVLHP